MNIPNDIGSKLGPTMQSKTGGYTDLTSIIPTTGPVDRNDLSRLEGEGGKPQSPYYDRIGGHRSSRRNKIAVSKHQA